MLSSLSSMEIQQIVDLLISERNRLSRAIEALGGSTHRGRPRKKAATTPDQVSARPMSKPSTRKRKPMTRRAEKSAVSADEGFLGRAAEIDGQGLIATGPLIARSWLRIDQASELFVTIRWDREIRRACRFTGPCRLRAAGTLESGSNAEDACRAGRTSRGDSLPNFRQPPSSLSHPPKSTLSNPFDNVVDSMRTDPLFGIKCFGGLSKSPVHPFRP